ncbi:hypothetical protein U27_05857 [Candidatus Vecturithrix granuli]|uniref:DUF218 domain-containing protein n=1 Tax=Vecturithrix granuli TaxID=1499967 RepID=A0A081C2S7_VECG1|nr:hypothetical protein U27_05857 [Candidatus Vecturithrix granuli]
MFFWLSKLFTLLIEPLTYIFILVVLALLFHRNPRFVKWCLGLALGVFLVFGTYFAPDLLTHLLENQYQIPAEVPRVDAVVVLAGIMNLKLSTPEYIEFNEGIERILTGIQMVKQGHARTLLISGGTGSLYDQEKKEAPLLRNFAIEFGVPESQILMEFTSRNTYENAIQTKRIMQEHGISQIMLVTTAIHLPRAMACFHKLGIDPIAYPVDFQLAPDRKYYISDIIPGPGAFRRSSAVLHEYIGLLAYKLAGYI